VVVRGVESDILTADMAAKMIEAQPKARLVDVAGAGHTVPGDQPDVFLKVLRQFLDS
jgi:pimeloyl-ACP methyl ester carboxylesterase